VLQCVAVCCSVLQCVLQRVAVCYNVLQYLSRGRYELVPSGRVRHPVDSKKLFVRHNMEDEYKDTHIIQNEYNDAHIIQKHT